ncbi:MAG: YVTN family beta-propeller repeat protein [Planctomycetota bacterium]|jgi:YVTN family beta-propeller protein
MPVVAKCSCGRKYALDESMIGQKVKCRGCGKVLRIPTQAELAKKTGGTPVPKRRPAKAAAPPPEEPEEPEEYDEPEDDYDEEPAAPRPSRGRSRRKGGAGKLVAVAVVVVVGGIAAAYALKRGGGSGPSGGGNGGSGSDAPVSEGVTGNAPADTPDDVPGDVPTPASAKNKPELDREGIAPTALALSPDKSVIYVSEAADGQVVAFDIASGKVTKTFKLPDPPEGVAVSADGKQLYVAGHSPAGKLHIVDTASGKITASVAVGHSPVGVTLSPDGRIAYVCNRFTNDVSVVDIASAKETAKIHAVHEPCSAAITPDGKLLFVANMIPLMPADGDFVASEITVIDTAAGKVTASIKLPNGAESVRGICMSPDGRYAYTGSILARFQLPTTQLERGWINTNAVSVIDTAGKKLLNTVLLDDVDNGAANPWALACTEDGKYLCVTHAGTHELSVIDRMALHAKLEKVAKGEKVSDASAKAEDVPNDLAFLVGLRRRLKLEGNGPRSVVLVGTKAYVGMYFSDTLCVLDISPDARPAPEKLSLGPVEPMSAVRKGERLFNDATACFQQWLSCASCHPDSRPDALNWDLLNDGLGNPKNASSMLNSPKTPPVMALGVRADTKTAVRAGFKFIQFTVVSEEDAQTVDAYIESLTPVPSPYLVNGKLSDAARRGSKVFEKAECGSCHSGPHFTDQEKHDIGQGKDLDKDKEFDTPGLVEIWRTAPYLYDGRALTMKDLLTKYNKDDSHGTTSDLTPKQLDDLAEFVLSQ